MIVQQEVKLFDPNFFRTRVDHDTGIAEPRDTPSPQPLTIENLVLLTLNIDQRLPAGLQKARVLFQA